MDLMDYQEEVLKNRASKRLSAKCWQTGRSNQCWRAIMLWTGRKNGLGWGYWLYYWETVHIPKAIIIISTAFAVQYRGRTCNLCTRTQGYAGRQDFGRYPPERWESNTCSSVRVCQRLNRSRWARGVVSRRFAPNVGDDNARGRNWHQSRGYYCASRTTITNPSGMLMWCSAGWINEQVNLNNKFFCSPYNKEWKAYWRNSGTTLITACNVLKHVISLPWTILHGWRSELHQPLAFDSYRKNRITGSIILVDGAEWNSGCEARSL